MRSLLRELGNPERAYRSIIVAGTNGKGSTSATLASILNTSGYRTGLYTSPHLVDLRERWTIGGEAIADASLDDAIEELQRAAKRAGITPTYFEALTLIAFIAFARADCEIAVLEVGMGGRLDATNVVRPIAALITPIGFDHMEFLGNTLRKIAAEKAGIIHRGAIVLTSNDDPGVLTVIRRRAAAFDCPFHLVTETHATPLAGAFQQRNAALAVRAAEELKPVLAQITAESIARGVAATRWRGRLEKIERAGKEIWIDGGHNAHAIRAILPFIANDIPAPRLLVFGIMGDKDLDDVTALLFPLFESVIATEPYPPRSATAAQLVARAQGLSIDAVAEPEPAKAIKRALASGYRSLVIAGSLYLAGAAIEFFDAHRDQKRRDEK
ncbi:MAG: dihydrofolate synthase / folylpolyglutamate synthase [Thermoanaerobaculia bacterium]|jgi:dihydrofolate synthase/folylpolyglutamate synthase|nr:dihydrofolate synthase / folylpolyglutamate synthase [Thermoanaerobaculia bacterium]